MCCCAVRVMFKIVDFILKLAIYVVQMVQEWLDASCLPGFKGNSAHLLYCICISQVLF